MWRSDHDVTLPSCLEVGFGFDDMSKPTLPIEATAEKP